MLLTQNNADILAQLRVFSIGPLELHTYGIILGIALVVGIFIFMKLVPDDFMKKTRVIPMITVIVLSALIGGRLAFILGFHELFVNDPLSIFYTWEGGMTIFGIISGGFIGYSLFWYFFIKPSFPYFIVPDIGVIALAVGQCIGRWGNFINEELYGLPTDQAIGIYISPENRLSGFESFSYFHPAFLYESLMMAAAAFTLFIFNKATKSQTVGTGTLTGLYLVLYGSIRLVMDRIRIDQQAVLGPLKTPDILSLLLILAGILALYYGTRTIKTKQ